MSAAGAGRELAASIESALEARWRSSPIAATFDGIDGHDHLLDDYAPEAIDDSVRELEQQLGTLAAIDPAALTPDERIDHRVLSGALSADLEEWRDVRAWTLHASLYSELALYSVHALLVRDEPPTEQRLECVRSRLEGLPAFLDQGLANLDAPPRALLEMGLAVCAGASSALGEPLEALAAGGGALGVEVRAAARRALEAFERHAAGLERLAASERPARSAALGRGPFERRLRDAHGIELGTEALLELSRRLRRDTERRLVALSTELGGGEDWRAHIDAARHDHPSAEELLGAYRDEVERARRFLEERGLVTMPDDELVVVETPLFERPQLPYAAIVPPPPMGPPRPGRFYVTPVDDVAPGAAREERLERHARAAIPVIAVHEAFPGHHLQFSLARRVASPVRRLYGSPVAWEGWALYCEELMHEQGFYASPLARLFQLRDLLWRAWRIEIDVRLHCEDLPAEEATRMLVEGAALEADAAHAEVLRYLVTPTQPLTYAVGRELILSLRERVASREGASFSLSRFHDRLLAHGHVSPALLDEAVGATPESASG